MPRVLHLVSWVGRTDLDASQGKLAAGEGPLASAFGAMAFSGATLLSNYELARVDAYCDWLGKRTTVPFALRPVDLAGNPMDFGRIYREVAQALVELRAKIGPDPELVLHLSPGTSAMAAVSILLAKTRFPARLIMSSREKGVVEADIPFDIAAELISPARDERDRWLIALAQGGPTADAAFAGIVHRCAAMQRAVAEAKAVAAHDVPVLILGESGTGKELFARAIHAASNRRTAPFIALNCGAIPKELVESELFGHVKGAFTGANQARSGVFADADGGTLFLDEVGELPPAAQVKLLRVLQERTVTPVGASSATDVNVRIIAATNRVLGNDVREGRFRLDLFYRLAVAVIQVPPLRERKGDLTPLIDTMLASVNANASSSPGWTNKKLSIQARNVLLEHTWPGNVRELLNTLTRAALWSTSDTITAEDARQAILPGMLDHPVGILNRSLGDGFSLNDTLAEVARHYLRRGMDQAGGVKKRAAALLGFENYQTLSNWLNKHGLE